MTAHDDSELFESLTPDELTKFRRALKRWYDRRARDLPWRRTGEPYRIWISEIMLQQTTVVAVIPYFERFLQRFPDIHALAAADESEVLKLWEGLGYYSRARNIHRAAKQLVDERDGEFPATVEELVALPGIGRYTAGAIVSFAFNRPAPIVEANTLRLYSRLLALEEDPRSTRGQRTLWAFAEHLLPRRNAGPFNQALMELGSQTCTPTEPDCAHCPARTICRAFASGQQNDIPVAAKRPDITTVFEASVAVRSGDRYLLRQNPEGQRWAGLWDFLRFPIDDPGRHLPARGLKLSTRLPAGLVRLLETESRQLAGVDVTLDRFLTEIRHSVTRFRIQLQCFVAEALITQPEPTDGVAWVTVDEFPDYPLSVTGRKLAKLLEERPASLNENT